MNTRGEVKVNSLTTFKQELKALSWKGTFTEFSFYAVLQHDEDDEEEENMKKIIKIIQCMHT